MNSQYLARMEQILALYTLEYREAFPVVCFDERPCFLIGDHVAGLEMKAGQPKREHYAYEKNGSCALLMAIEPKAATRLAQVCDRRYPSRVRPLYERVGPEIPGGQEDQSCPR